MLNFELKIEEANLILAALSKAPYEQVAALIANLQQQAGAQISALEEARKAEAATAE